MNPKDTIKLHFPLPLVRQYEAMSLENEPQLRVYKLLDLAEGAVQYCTLLLLAYYNQHQLQQPNVESIRKKLGKPSFGHWVSLYDALLGVLHGQQSGLPLPPKKSHYKEDVVVEAGRALAAALGQSAGFTTLKPVDFLKIIVNYRNKKVGHGNLPKAEAKAVVSPLRRGLEQFLTDLPLLSDAHLVYIATVQWLDPVYAYNGVNLNVGGSVDRLQLKGEAQLKPGSVYLHHPAGDLLTPLYPFCDYDEDIALFYIYGELTNKGRLLLKCPWDAPGVDATRLLDADKGMILGSPAPQPARPKPATPAGQPKSSAKEANIMRNWYDIITPHADIRKGHFDEAVFAADVGDVADGKAPADYNDPYVFFKKTYLTDGLTSLLTRVHDKLTAGQGSGVVQIQTPFGGGKTHALVTIFHYLKNGQKIKELLPGNLGLLNPNVAVIAGNHWDPLAGRSTPLVQGGTIVPGTGRVGGGEGQITRRTFWGDVAYQIGGQAGYEQFRQNDEQRISPGKEKLREFLTAHQPFVLLFDEILEYINRAADVKDQLEVSLGTQTFSFFQELTEAVSTLPHGMLVVTLPSSKLEDFGEREEEALARLGKIFGRLESIETPVRGEEIYAVIRRRLFEVETLKRGPMQETIHRYFLLYQEHKDDLPPKARDVNYKERMEMAYPFHPDLIDILSEKWGTYSTFQRTRGVLRLLANVVEDLYEREASIDMILPGDINLDKPGIRQEFIKHIGAEYESVIASDIAGHEAKSQLLDRANRGWKHLAQRISNAIFVHSFSADDAEKGIILPYIKLAVLRSDTIPAMVTDVLQKLDNELWYLNSRGDAHYFSRIPNLNRMILDKKELFNQAYEAELESIINKEVGRKFIAYLWPTGSDGIVDNKSLKLVILRPEDDGARIPDWIERKGNAFREYQNTLFFVVADTAAFARLREDVKTYMALQEIEGMVKSGEMPQLETKRDEVQRRLRDIRRDFSYNVRRMYHILRFGGRKIDLGQPTAGSEDMSSWYWRELTDGNVGAIVEQLGYRIIANKLLAGNDQVAAAVVLDQFYKNPDLPAPSAPEVVARAIQLGVEAHAFGLSEMTGDALDPNKLKFGDNIKLDEVTFEAGVYLVSPRKAEELLAKIPPPPTLPGLGDDTKPEPDGGDATPAPKPDSTPSPEPTLTPPASDKYHRVRLVIKDIPAGKIADINRGVLLPLSSLVSDMKFTLDIDVTSSDGVPKATLENKIKETIRQIGAVIEEQQLE
jgi:hypothetical protein